MKRVLIIGDIIMDVHSNFTFKKKCPDDASMLAYEHKDSTVLIGGAGNVALNLTALCPDVYVDLFGPVEPALAGMLYKRSGSRIFCHGPMGSMVKKERIYAGDTLVRLDRFSSDYPPSNAMSYLYLQSFLKRQNDLDLVIVSDYAHGMVTDEMLGLLSQFKDRILVDTKLTDLSVFKGSFLIKLNESEWESVQRCSVAPERNFTNTIVTKGSGGCSLYVTEQLDEKRVATHLFNSPGFNVEAVDVCGCGDTFLAGLAASLLESNDVFTATKFANAAAATVVTQPMTAVADLEKTLELLGKK